MARGGKVVLLDVDKAPLDALVAELGSDNAVSALADVTDLGQVESAVRTGVARFGSASGLRSTSYRHVSASSPISRAATA